MISFRNSLKISLLKIPDAHTTSKRICYVYKEKLQDKYIKDKKYHKVRDLCHYTSEYSDAHSICYLKKILRQDEASRD